MSELKENKKIKFLNKPVSLWVGLLFVFLAFTSGVLAGGSGQFLNNQIIIKGADPVYATSSSSDSGNVTNTKAELPSYLQKDVDFNLYWKTWNIIKSKFYDKNVLDTKLFYGSLAGLVSALGDPYSVFMTPSDADEFQKDLEGSFEGVGMEIAIKNNQLIVVSPLEDSPAMKAGLRPKDWIIRIDGVSTEKMSAAQAVKLIRGPKGTKVKLSIYREGAKDIQEIEVTRDVINVKSLTWEYKANGSIIWIKVRQFNDDTIPLFDKAIKEIIAKKNVKGVILDLRNNPGGYLDTAIAMAGEWDGEQVVVSERNREGQEIKHIANSVARLKNYKTVVLIDAGSASASEIVAGALQDWKKATIVGMKSFGKGSVQDLTNLPDGSQIKLTIAKWFTPNGRSIDEHGIEPDIKVDLTDEDYNKDLDPQLDKALELLK